ncbi:hypothetical protein Taro_015889 [Colocasia esculenta]|uniref:Cytochrome P450 71A1 n=1 Tax=Colocasia esculenta TaxID=4460 RepID=A0A843UCJ7_COLES|nr:hypothetical protein [Colocasia esculenta]
MLSTSHFEPLYQFLGFALTVTSHLSCVTQDVFIAGTDTGTLALEWGMAELVRNPGAMRKAQAEVRRAVGEAEFVEDRHVRELHYLKLVVREALRLHPPGPFLLPRASRADTRVAGFDVPVNTRVTINVWAIGRDPDAWEDPDAFLPERFEGSAVDFRGQHFQLLPFGAGRRGCPGVGLGTAVVELALANLLHCFDWEVPGGGRGEDLDMEEEFGIVIRRKHPLLLRATPWTPSSEVQN